MFSWKLGFKLYNYLSTLKTNDVSAAVSDDRYLILRIYYVYLCDSTSPEMRNTSKFKDTLPVKWGRRQEQCVFSSATSFSTSFWVPPTRPPPPARCAPARNSCNNNGTHMGHKEYKIINRNEPSNEQCF